MEILGSKCHTKCFTAAANVLICKVQGSHCNDNSSHGILCFDVVGYQHFRGPYCLFLDPEDGCRRFFEDYDSYICTLKMDINVSEGRSASFFTLKLDIDVSEDHAP